MFYNSGISDPNIPLIGVYQPGSKYSGNTLGIFYHHTPVFIGGADEPDVSAIAPRPSKGGDWMLAVDGPAIAKEFYVETGWPDFVFESGYNLRELSEVERYIAENKHLPDVPSAADIAKSGVALGTTEAKLLQKIEELTPVSYTHLTLPTNREV